jgi:hypothetical protein
MFRFRKQVIRLSTVVADSTTRQRLSEAIPGFAEAVDWPFGEEATQA